MPPDSHDVAERKRTDRSAVSNGHRLYLDGVDQRTAIARRFRDIFNEIVGDLGGPDGLSEGQRQIARRCAQLSVEAERMEAAAAKDEAFDVDLYQRITNSLGRAFERIGLERRARDVTPPDPLSYAAARAREAGQ